MVEAKDKKVLFRKFVYIEHLMGAILRIKRQALKTFVVKNYKIIFEAVKKFKEFEQNRR